MTSWSEMKELVEVQMASDPQRATLSTRAWQGVEEGLRHLTGVGYNFEIAPRGTLQELTESREPAPGRRPLSIADAQELVSAPKNVQTRQFEAMVDNFKSQPQSGR